ncbi:Cytochrome P450 4c3 [Araneus ventricosus]|uniref:Cytochrome P450 4c3 n=1 Tax=Araneus ventricosus TaxID=182803 RepID=A0A4Y2HTE4_ARAVE|nr:Cytochrome P450 4c3 [Araneus ventricosus]
MWTLFFIGHHPDVQSKLYEELDRTFGKDVDTPISVNDLNHLDYMECVIKESNRIYTIVPIHGRQFYEDTKICGYTIPKGSAGIVLSYYLHRDETVFPDPEKFDPDPVLPENEINIPDFAYILFSAGPRNCIVNYENVAGARKCDLKILAEELGETVNDMHKMKDLKKMILASKEYDEESAKEWLNTIINERIEREENKLRQEE